MNKKTGKINLMLTRKCNQSCAYCFASEAMDNPREDDSMTIEECKWCIDRLAGEEDVTISLLGGEPTLHPHLARIVEYALDKCLRVLVFSNLLTPRIFECLTSNRVDIVANINRLDSYNAAQLENIRRNLDRYSDNVIIGFNIHTLESDYIEVLDLVDLHGLDKMELRLGFASPTPTRDNSFVPVDDFDKVGPYLVKLADHCRSRSIKVGYDCGFVRCMFDEEDLEELDRLDAAAEFPCGTPLDIGPGLRAWHCFPLSAYRSLYAPDFGSFAELRERLSAIYHPFRAFGVKKECALCDHKTSGLCHGGCLGHVLASLDSVPTSVRVSRAEEI